MTTSPVFKRLKEAAPTISVGMLTADLTRLGSEIALLEETGTVLVHFDVMDGAFCPMMTIGPPIVGAVRTRLVKDVHLMIDDPLEKLDTYVAAGADVVTVQIESDRHIHRVLQKLGSVKNANDPDRGLVRGIALNPGTPIEVVEPLLDNVEMVLVLAVNPGFGGQKFIASTPRRLEKARKLIAESGREILLGVDGGVKRDNISDIAAMGPDIIITGSAVFDGKAPKENAEFMLNAVRSASPRGA